MDLIKRCLRWLASLRLVTDAPALPIGEGTMEVYWDDREQRIGITIPHGGGSVDATIVLLTTEQARIVGRILIHSADTRDGRGISSCKPSVN